MAEGFGPYHVPQQTRRDKLRILSQNLEPSIQGCAGFLPLCDPSLLPPDLLAAAAAGGPVHPASSGKSNDVEGGSNFMGFPYLDPNPSALQPVNPSTNNNNPNAFLYNPREFGDPYTGAEVVLFKPQPFSLAGRQDQSRLSLSLSSHPQGGSSSPLELNLQRYGSDVYAVPAITGGPGSVPNEVSRSSVPLGPFTGYASVLKGSRFLKPMQQLLQEFCDVGQMIYAEKMSPGSDSSSGPRDSPVENLAANGIDGDSLGETDLPEHRRKKSKLLSMLDEVYKRYKQYYRQMQDVVASFECVAGLGNAAPYANLALEAMSKHFKRLKNAITDQRTDKPRDQINAPKGGVIRLGSSDRGRYCQRPLLEHQPIWRPQRGLPERAVTVLRAWLFEHFLHPYPTDTDKLMLAKQTGLSRSQVSNWFINARVRLWKPMVEEIHMLETRQVQKASQKDQNWDCSRSSDPLSSANSLASENPSTSMQRVQDTASKRCRSVLPDLPEGSHPLNTTYNSCSLSSHPQVAAVGVSMAGTSTGVSLTLGLHQNNGIRLSEPFPITAAQRFGLGLEVSGEAYVMGGFEAQNRHFGGGQLLHDFVG